MKEALIVIVCYIVIASGLVIFWKRLLRKSKTKNPIHFNKPDND